MKISDDVKKEAAPVKKEEKISETAKETKKKKSEVKTTKRSSKASADADEIKEKMLSHLKRVYA